MTYALIHPPQAEPLTLAEVKAHLRLDSGDEDALLAALIRTAREHLERTSGLCLLRQTWRLYLDRWPQTGVILIGRTPVQAIETILVFDGEGRSADITAGEKLLDGAARPARLWLRDPCGSRPGDERHRDRFHCRLRRSGNGCARHAETRHADACGTDVRLSRCCRPGKPARGRSHAATSGWLRPSAVWGFET